MLAFAHTYPTPAENLAADEALMDAAEAGEIDGALRFWESPIPFVTLGYTNKAAMEANLESCAAAGVPVLRRVSGGGTVLQGPGCLNYAVVHPVDPKEPLNVGATNCFVMRRQRSAFAELTGAEVTISGHTDLAIDGRKFSGNAQRRKGRFFLFHGTLLLNMDLGQIQTLLRSPSKEPDYRAGRTHLDFITNLHLSVEAVQEALMKVWSAIPAEVPDLSGRISQLVEEKYGREDWNFRF
jgi:lipoate-protein ligase A